DDKWIRFLGQSCLEKIIDDNHLISKISLLSIIFENFKELSENQPTFIASTLSLIGFVVPSKNLIPTSNSSHLSTYGSYYHLSKTSILHIITSNLWIRWISFKKEFQIKFENFQEKHPFFRDSFVKPIKDFYYVGHSSTILAIPLPNFVSYPTDYNFWKALLLPASNPFIYLSNDDKRSYIAYLNLIHEILVEIESLYMLPHQRRKENWFPFVIFYECRTDKLRELIINWSGDRVPYISKNLKDVLLLPEEQPSLAQIEGAIEELRYSIKVLKGSAKSKEPSLARIEEAVGDSYTRIKDAIEELKESIIHELRN
ncbi:26856_t:CDS:2, partial [Racocetra persica]